MMGHDGGISNLTKQNKTETELSSIKTKRERTHKRSEARAEANPANTIQENHVPFPEEQISPSYNQTESYDADFEEFWNEYPQQVGKNEAYSIYRGISAENRKKILPALRLVKESEEWKRDGGALIPNPSKWLTQRGWK